MPSLWSASIRNLAPHFQLSSRYFYPAVPVTLDWVCLLTSFINFLLSFLSQYSMSQRKPWSPFFMSSSHIALLHTTEVSEVKLWWLPLSLPFYLIATSPTPGSVPPFSDHIVITLAHSHPIPMPTLTSAPSSIILQNGFDYVTSGSKLQVSPISYRIRPKSFWFVFKTLPSIFTFRIVSHWLTTGNALHLSAFVRHTLGFISMLSAHPFLRPTCPSSLYLHLEILPVSQRP